MKDVLPDCDIRIVNPKITERINNLRLKLNYYGSNPDAKSVDISPGRRQLSPRQILAHKSLG